MTRPVRLTDLPKLVRLHRDARHRLPLFGAPDLTYLFWEATMRCNLRCRHCGSSCEATTPFHELTTEQIKRIFREVAEDFDARRIFVSITGGEPLLRADLVEVVRYMSSLGFESCIVSNGTLLRRDIAQQLLDAGMQTVSISIDGLESEHDSVRGKGTFARALEGLATAAQVGFVQVEAITCVRPANLGSLDAIEQTVRSVGATQSRYITIDRMGRVTEADLWLEAPHVRQLLDYIARRRTVRADGYDVRFSCGGFLGIEHELVVRPEHGQCFAGLRAGSILCDGQVSGCPSLPRSWAQGSALEQRLSQIWQQRFAFFRDLQARRSGVCEGCGWFSICLGGGLHERQVQPDTFCWLDRQAQG